jgi:hypothetical protein
VAALAGLVLGLAPSCKRAVQPRKPTAPAVTAAESLTAPTNYLLPAYVSVFEDLMPPKGRDPFFPNSHRRDPVATGAGVREKPAAAPELVLKGIVGSPNHRLAVINSAILEVNEEAMVRLPDGGRARVRCLEIGQDHAVIKVEGELQPKRLELNKKGF